MARIENKGIAIDRSLGSGNFNPTITGQWIEAFNDCLGNIDVASTGTGMLGLGEFNAGGGNVQRLTANADNRPGLWQFVVSADGDDASVVQQYDRTFQLGDLEIVAATAIQITTLSTVSEEYSIRFGFDDNAVQPTTGTINGVFFEYDRELYGDNNMFGS